MRFDHVLVTTDLSEESNLAVEMVRARGLEAQDRIVLLSVVPIVPIPEWPYTLGPEYEKAMEERVRNELEKIKEERLSAFSVTVEVITAFNVPEVICETAKTQGCDAIIMARHGHGAIANLFIGSTVQRVIRLAHCPVIVITRPDGMQKPAE